jgi:hypothetical protein
LQHRQGPSFFEQASIDEPQFGLVQTGFQQPVAFAGNEISPVNSAPISEISLAFGNIFDPI